MPSGAACLLALAVAAACGSVDGALRPAGLSRGTAAVWALAAAAGSLINLPWPPRDPAVVWNVGGTVVPAAFAAFLLHRGGLRPVAVLRACVASAALLCAILGWAEPAGVGWPATAAAAAAVAAAAALGGGGPRGALAGAAAALPLSAAARAALGGWGFVPWPATLGGGAAFAAGILALIGAQAASRLAALAAGRARPAPAAVRGSAP